MCISSLFSTQLKKILVSLPELKKFGEEPIFVIGDGSWSKKLSIINPKFKKWKGEYIDSKADAIWAGKVLLARAIMNLDESITKP